MFKVNGQRSRSHRKVMYQQETRYNTAIDRFSDFKLEMAWKKTTGVTICVAVGVPGPPRAVTKNVRRNLQGKFVSAPRQSNLGHFCWAGEIWKFI